MKIIGYLIFAGFYYIYKFLCQVKSKKVFAIMTHDSSKDGNVGLMVEYLREKKEGFTFHCLEKAERSFVKDIHILRGKLSFFVIKSYHLATSEYVMMDNTFLPMAYIKFRKNIRIVQLWHGTGTIKRFGQDVNTGTLKKLEKRANSRITHLIVNSEESKKEYAKAFGIEEDKTFIYGLPRTDIFFDKDKRHNRIEKFFEEYPELKDKKIILYAPTFRDHERDHPSIALDTKRLTDQLSEDYVLLLRLHPFVEQAYKASVGTIHERENVISMTSYPDISTLLLVADYLITDYSSVIFEYCLLVRPMIFYAYDLEEFSDHGRGFYHPYLEYVPGPVAQDMDTIIKLLKKNEFDLEKVHNFIDRNYRYLDGKSAERLYRNVFHRSE